MEILRIGETTHERGFCVLREKGHPVYLLLLVETPARFETKGAWTAVPAHAAVLFRPGQRHSYCADGETYTDCWMHIASGSPLLYDGFPFGSPIPLRSPERFYQLFRIIRDEFFAERRTRESVVCSLTSALLEMLSSEVEAPGPLFYPFLNLREEVFRVPARPWRVQEAARSLGVSCGYFHALYRAYFRTTFLADVIAARIQTAEELLLSTPDSVEQIAERCGYWNTEHFIRQFRKETGTTPHRFRTAAVTAEGAPRV